MCPTNIYINDAALWGIHLIKLVLLSLPKLLILLDLFNLMLFIIAKLSLFAN
jgi:hypothetical protein